MSKKTKTAETSTCKTAKKATCKVATKKITRAVKSTVQEKKCECSLGQAKLTIVVAKVDAGWGNSIYIRGNGAGLSWDKGVLMQCVGDQEWLWEKKGIESDFEFKFLLNDEVWETAENSTGKPNEIHTYYPTF